MIYLDNAATSFPKPPMVVRAMAGALGAEYEPLSVDVNLSNT